MSLTRIFLSILAISSVNALPNAKPYNWDIAPVDNKGAPSTPSAPVYGAPSSTVIASSAPSTAVPPPPPPPPADEKAKDAALKSLFVDLFTAPTAVKRLQRLLTSANADGKFGEALLTGEDLKKAVVFDFNNATKAKDARGGAAKAANIDTFPILTGLGISTTLGFLGACGMNSPHVHPRATEFLTVVEGAVSFGHILENGFVRTGSQEVTGTLTKFQGTVFPMGSIHYQINESCNNATFVATLNDSDPGTSQIAQNFFGLNGQVVQATLGFPETLDGKDIESFRKNIPANVALSIESCLKKCNIPKVAPAA